MCAKDDSNEMRMQMPSMRNTAKKGNQSNFKVVSKIFTRSKETGNVCEGPRCDRKKTFTDPGISALVRNSEGLLQNKCKSIRKLFQQITCESSNSIHRFFLPAILFTLEV